MELISEELKIFCGNANRRLSEAIADSIGQCLSDAVVEQFADGETRVRIVENVRGTDAFVIQPSCPPVNDRMMELLIIIDALRRASARRITAVIPYFGYARQDRKTRGREPITAKLVSNLITEAGADRVLTVDLHAGQIQGFFDIPLDHLTAIPTLADYFKDQKLSDLVVVSPDAGGVARARHFADLLGVGIAIVDKYREKPNVAEVMNIVGQVKGKTAVLVDEMIDTGGTLCRAADALVERGADRVFAAATHAVLTDPATRRLAASPIEEIVVCDTVPVSKDKLDRLDNLRVLSLAELLGQAIDRIHQDRSVSALFRNSEPDA